MIAEYLPLEALAATVGLPRRYLKDLAGRGDIPALNVNGRLRFDEGAVREALARLANRPPNELTTGVSRC